MIIFVYVTLNATILEWQGLESSRALKVFSVICYPSSFYLVSVVDYRENSSKALFHQLYPS